MRREKKMGVVIPFNMIDRYIKREREKRDQKRREVFRKIKLGAVFFLVFLVFVGANLILWFMQGGLGWK